MVKNPGAKVRPHRLRPLASPRDVAIETDVRGLPAAVVVEGAKRAVTCVQDRWRIDDEWWRDPGVARMYYQLQLEGDRVITVYQDLCGGAWCVQRY